MNTVAIIQARMGSTRLPGKVLMDLGARKVLGWVRHAAMLSSLIDDIWCATSTDPRDQAIEDYLYPSKALYRGSEIDVLARIAECAELAGADIVVRLTGDCPFLDPHVIDDVLTQFRDPRIMYASNVSPETWPDGLDVQACRIECLRAANTEATLPSDRDTVMQYIERNRRRWPAANVTCPLNLVQERWVLDTAEDLEFCRTVVRDMATPNDWHAMLDYLDSHQDVRAINRMWARNERYKDALSKQDTQFTDWPTSKEAHTRALRYAPY
jgi:glutamate-1-semialdehyde 2,1-aminomutase